MTRAYCAVLTFMVVAAWAAPPWHQDLYLGNDGTFRARIQVDVRNGTGRDLAGVPVTVQIGDGEGQADLAGAQADAVRVCNAEGVEMLWSITGPDGAEIKDGPVPAGGQLALPVECAADGTATYFVYYDNPQAWRVPDFLQGVHGLRNGGMEEGTGAAPAGWQHDSGDQHHQATWVTENPRSGQRCLKTVVSKGAEHTWIATRQRGIHIIGGAGYTMRAWVKAQDVEGFAGWYIHVGNDENSMLISPMLDGGSGTYDWKEVTAKFVAPEDATVSDLGTVLRGTGTAWFDDVSLECDEDLPISARAYRPERLQLTEIGADAPWYDEDPGDDLRWEYRMPVRLVNASETAVGPSLTAVNITGLMARLRGKANEASIRVVGQEGVIPHYRLQSSVLFEARAPAGSIQCYYLYVSTDPRIPAGLEGDYEALLSGDLNLVRNGSFELGDALPEDWPGGAEGERPKDTEMGLDEPGLFGSRSARIHIPHESKPAWTGWRQDVPVAPDKTYLFASWLKCEDLKNGTLQLHAHYRNAEGELCESRQYTSAGPAIGDTSDWTLVSALFPMPPDIASFQLHLTMLATGTAWHDGVVLVETTASRAGRLEAAAAPQSGDLALWPMNAIVKVFPDDVPPREPAAMAVSAARGEYEPMQFALRGPEDLESVSISASAPTGAGGTLPPPEINVVGYVPIDHPTSYYSSKTPTWHRKFPTVPGACDGWPGMWPDPLLPTNTLDLAANQTGAFWVTVYVPEDAGAGEYSGTVTLSRGGETVAQAPYSLRVWDFSLPQERHVGAIYDLRGDGRWALGGRTAAEQRTEMVNFMAQRRVCPDKISPDPIISYENGKATADFTEFDKAATHYLDELKMPHFYTPGMFYLFGWGHPPGNKFGEKPYDAEYPYEDVDRTKLRPEYKRAYQACLKLYWDHLKEKGWDDRCILYISDEPFYGTQHIIEQMQALCDMIHEVDPKIPIYSSTWHHVPQWDGYIDVWGIGHYGVVSTDLMEEIKEGGARLYFTTDGQMCTDTPYCGVERLLPHYCFKYGVEAYEFWGLTWLTYNPYEFGWHSYISQAGVPGEQYWVRYPNGDGFLAYPGSPIDYDGIVSSVRLEQAREGEEDYEYLYLLRELIVKGRAAGKDTTAAEEVLARSAELVDIPNAGGRYSTRFLPDPDAVFVLKQSVAEAIEQLSQ